MAKVNDEEKVLFDGSKSKFWQVLKEEMEESLKMWDLSLEKQIAEGASFDEIGKTTVVINLAKGVVKKIIDKVEDAVEICEAEDEK